MVANPWVVIGVGLAGSIGMMMGTMATAPEKYVPHFTHYHRQYGIYSIAYRTDNAIATSKNTPSGPASTSHKQRSSRP